MVKKNDEVKLGINDFLIKPAAISKISDINQINPYDSYGFLPLILNDKGFGSDLEKSFSQNNVLFSRKNGGGEILDNQFIELTLTEVINLFEPNGFNIKIKRLFIVNDIFNDYDNFIKIIGLIKKNNPNIILMVGDVINPSTYKFLSDAGADYVRVGLDNDSYASLVLGVGYPIGALVKECHDISLSLNTPAKIVANYGIDFSSCNVSGFSSIYKALALGSDYVMVNSFFRDDTDINYSVKNFTDGLYAVMGCTNSMCIDEFNLRVELIKIK